MSEKNNIITLYPSNWLYNAGVVGFLYSLKRIEEINVNEFFLDNTIEFNSSLFNKLNLIERYFKESPAVANLVGNNKMYPNYLQSNQKDFFNDYIKTLSNIEKKGSCDFCPSGWHFTINDFDKLKKIDPGNKKFVDRVNNYQMIHGNLLGPSPGEFPNGFWNNNQSIHLCHLCSFLIVHHHLPITTLTRFSQVFINAPSFHLMYDLNMFVKELYGKSTDEENKKLREILATTIIEYVRKMQSVLGVWTTMNIEIVHKYKIKNDKGKLEDRIEFFSLPADVINIISDRGISNILSDLAEFKILNIVLEEKYSFLTEIGYKLLREGSKDYNNRNEKLINSILYQWKNQNNPIQTANKILRLYSLIEDKLKGNEQWKKN